jgi:hypothetical protein
MAGRTLAIGAAPERAALVTGRITLLLTGRISLLLAEGTALLLAEGTALLLAEGTALLLAEGTALLLAGWTALLLGGWTALLLSGWTTGLLAGCAILMAGRALAIGAAPKWRALLRCAVVIAVTEGRRHTEAHPAERDQQDDATNQLPKFLGRTGLPGRSRFGPRRKRPKDPFPAKHRPCWVRGLGLNPGFGRMSYSAAGLPEP